MTINKGSVETILVQVRDEQVLLFDLPEPTRYDILDADGADVTLAQVATTEGLEAACLVDTSDMEMGDYELFLYFTVGAETPRLGPHKFRVV